VEHGVTELITGLDLVALMLDIARGERLPFSQEEIERRGWAIEARLNAEDPKSFSPSFGVISRLRIPQGPRVRVSPGVSEGDEVPPYYDSLIMLVMTVGPRREDAIRTMERALTELEVEGVKTLAPLLLSLIRHESFSSATFSTQFIESHIEELASEFAPQDEEVRKIARFIAEVSALGPRDWM
jgi:acetyl-CoA carboxylase biotin carboxylase subunit/propionyl-CoA carboxylase alpha chain